MGTQDSELSWDTAIYCARFLRGTANHILVNCNKKAPVRFLRSFFINGAEATNRTADGRIFSQLSWAS